jgi:hypothetical protein
MPIQGGEHPEADAKRHSRALQDAQALLEALADRYDVLTSKGDPAAAAFLAPEPLVYDEAGPVPSRHQLHRPRTVPTAKLSAVVAAS